MIQILKFMLRLGSHIWNLKMDGNTHQILFYVSPFNVPQPFPVIKLHNIVPIKIYC